MKKNTSPRNLYQIVKEIYPMESTKYTFEKEISNGCSTGIFAMFLKCDSSFLHSIFQLALHDHPSFQYITLGIEY